MIGKYKNLSNLIKFINTSDIFDDYRNDKNNMLKKLSKYYYMYIRNKLDEIDKSNITDTLTKNNILEEISKLSFTVNGKVTTWNLIIWNEDFTDIDVIKSIYVLLDFIQCHYNKEEVVLFL